MYLTSKSTLTSVFTCHSAVSGVVTAGEKALVSLFGSKPVVGLNSIRYQRYFEKLATKTSHIEPQNLPLTAAAAPQTGLDPLANSCLQRLQGTLRPPKMSRPVLSEICSLHYKLLKTLGLSLIPNVVPRARLFESRLT